MKRIIIILFMFTYSTMAFGQVELKIDAVEIANYVKTSFTQFDVGIGLVSNANPRILVRTKLINHGQDTIEIHDNDVETQFVEYVYQKHKYHIEGTSIYDQIFGFHSKGSLPRFYIPPGESEYLVMSFVPTGFPTENFMQAFFEIIPTIKIIYTRTKPQKGLPNMVESGKIDWTQITVNADSPIISNTTRIAPKDRK